MTQATKKDKEAKTVGRPRANRQKPAAPVGEEILIAARELFKTKGFSATTTREIAELAGLRQPSLFHYFKNKHEIFAAVAMGAVLPVIDFIKAEKSRKTIASERLYRLIYFDTYHLCTNKNALGSPFMFPEINRDALPEFWESRDEIITAYRTVLRAGKRQQKFVFDNLEATTHLLFGLGESTLHWFRTTAIAPAEVAHTAASVGVRSVADSQDQEQLKRFQQAISQELAAIAAE